MLTITICWMIGLTLLIEGITCFFRFGLKLEATQDTRFLRRLTFGLRIHHGYLGFLLACGAFFFPADHASRVWLLRVGVALLASDLVHHFLVLWPVTGEHQFDLAYPRPEAVELD